jgi:hypothetical protein
MLKIKDNYTTKMNNIMQLGCLFSKWLRLFVDFSSAIVGIFFREPNTQKKSCYPCETDFICITDNNYYKNE